ncbi:aminoglycoside adenylyltransferase domain-containing protein [Spongiactinospora sp. TRM90649]|uniref:aminoglycoside adenylyltransferase domain-containing protein n=1 Tax=Spongiactinospora sp. TRM90649 TaxID=3031114 RepID=UPI0023F696FF|nr:aminoglycoside adenylyltransferase domain-containing protein [Spongiactinospora sp. TRM90649]MDF5757513.1 DUF4111 domain-containing protein [Spongiactinospora sp. TRM90649]
MPLHPAAEPIVTRYLAVADRVLPGRITGFYVVGSAALGAWRPGRSDIDFVAVVDGRVGERVRATHVLGNLTTVARAVRHRRPSIPETMNGVFVAAHDLGLPVTRIRPLASHSGWRYRRGHGFDVNPVMWKILAERGIAVRGPVPADLGLDPEPGRLRAWNLENLNGHWRRWGERAMSARPPRKPLVPPHRVALASLLAPVRLHRTVATGEVISKQQAGPYALDTFPARWHPLIRAGLAHLDGEPPPGSLSPSRVPALAGEFVLTVVADADRP